MEMSYVAKSNDEKCGPIYVRLTESDIQILKEKKELEENGSSLKIDDSYAIPEPLRDGNNPTKIVGIHISNQLFDLFLDICKHPNGRACIERIGTSLSVELLHDTILFH